MNWTPGELVAERAHTATEPSPCSLCAYGIVTGQKVARLLDGGGWAHVSCIAAAAPDHRITR